MNKNGKKNIVVLLISLIIIVSIVLIMIFINNKKYINNVDFYLNGDSLVEIEEGTRWQDPLFVAKYNDKSISNSVVISSNLNINKFGTYEITYTINKGMSSKVLKRTVIVKEKNIGLTLTLIGDELMYLSKGSKFIDPGYKALNNNIDISNEVIIKNNVDTNKIGEYVIEYKIEKDVYIRKLTRTIKVVNFDYQIKLDSDNEYVKENKVIFSTNDSNYDYVLLPDGSKNFDKNIIYNITDNKEYAFVIYNKLGFYEEKKFVINNIDKQLPSGTCTGYMYDNYTTLSVTSIDDLGIKGYEYVYGNNNSGMIDKREFTYKDYINNASVNIYDKVNNKVSIKCNMIDKSTMTPSSYKSYTFVDPDTSRKMNYWLYIPDNLTERNSVPLLIYLHGDGSRGTNINLVNNYAFPKFIRDGQDYPFMMIAGQIGNDTNWTNEGTYKRLMKIVNNVINTYNVNPKKIMIAGGSSGGGGAYKITSAYPKYFSCTIIGSGIYDSAYRHFANQLIYTPMWIFHGTDDRNISYSSVKSFSEYIKSLGGNVIFKGIEGAGHGVTETSNGFNNTELINWMISQERN